MVKVWSLVACCLTGVLCALAQEHTPSEDLPTSRLDNRYLDDETIRIPLYRDAPNSANDIPDKIYAGPLKPTENDEVIIVSRDNVQQLVKTLLLAYTHSKDPSAAKIFKDSGLGALKSTFKHMGKDNVSDSFLKAAKKIIEEMNMDAGEEELVAEFAERYLETHKFKIIVPESFLLYEKEMLEFLEMKKKMSKKRGRSMSDPEIHTADELEVLSVAPYTGRQFTTSIIPGLDLTWIALLGGMMAIPYYFWSAPEEADARKDDFKPNLPPVPSFLPPQYSQGMNMNEVRANGRLNRGRRPSPQRGPQPIHITPQQLNRFPKMPAGFDPKSLNNKEYKEWFNNYYYHHFKQLPKGAIPPNSKMTPALIGVPHGGSLSPAASGNMHFIHRGKIPMHGPINRNFVARPLTGPISSGLLPPPNTLGRNPKKPEASKNSTTTPSKKSSNELSGQESVPRPSVVLNNLSVHLPEQFDPRKPRPNPLLNSKNKNLPMNHAQPQLSGPAFRPPPMMAPGGSRPRPHAPKTPIGMNPPPGVRGPPRSPAPLGPAGSTPGLRWQPYNSRRPLGPRPLPPLAPLSGQRLPAARPGRQPQNRRVPTGIRAPPVTVPMLPPPMAQEELGSGEKRDTFGSFRPDREGNTHFKVSFDKSKHAENITQRTKSHPVEKKTEPTVVKATPEKVMKLDDPVLDLSKNTGPKIYVIQPKSNKKSPQPEKQTQVSIPTESNPTQSSKAKEAERLLRLKKQRQQQMDYEQEIRRQREEKEREQRVRLQHEKQQLERRKQLEARKERPSPAPVSRPTHFPPLRRRDDGFMPVYGPPASPALLRSNSPRPELPKPSAFLDKLLAEQKENKSNPKPSYVKPPKITKKKDIKRYKKTQKVTTSAPTRQTTPEPTTASTQRQSVFVRKPTSQHRMSTELAETDSLASSVRVVTSKSVVTSRPVPLGKYHPAYLGFKGESRQPQKDKFVVVGEPVYENSTSVSANEINVSTESRTSAKKYSSLEEAVPHYEQSYKKVLKKFQAKKLYAGAEEEPEDFEVEASEQSLVTESPAEEVLVQSSAGFVNGNHGSVNRILKDVSSEASLAPTATPAPATPSRNPAAKGKNVPMYALDPFYGPRLSRADAIFAQMDIEEEGCREQVVCNMYKNPEVYTPLSDFLSRQLTVTLEELQKPQVADERILRFFRYLQAARTGQDGADCLAKYSSCHKDTTKLSHKPILDAFYKVSDLMNRNDS